MHKFETYLKEIGFVAYIRGESEWIEDPKPGFYSSMYAFRGANCYLKRHYKCGDKVICFGLHEAGHGPTLIYPRPRMKDADGDAAMAGILVKYPPEEVYRAMYDRSIVLEP